MVSGQRQREQRTTDQSKNGTSIGQEAWSKAFTLSDPPGERQGAEALRLRLAVSGKLRAELSQDGATVLLKGERGKVVMRYSEVKAWDAEHRALTAKLVVEGEKIGIEVDDRGAQYPVTIDPVITDASGQA